MRHVLRQPFVPCSEKKHTHQIIFSICTYHRYFFKSPTTLIDYKTYSIKLKIDSMEFFLEFFVHNFLSLKKNIKKLHLLSDLFDQQFLVSSFSSSEKKIHTKLFFFIGT